MRFLSLGSVFVLSTLTLASSDRFTFNDEEYYLDELRSFEILPESTRDDIFTYVGVRIKGPDGSGFYCQTRFPSLEAPPLDDWVRGCTLRDSTLYSVADARTGVLPTQTRVKLAGDNAY